MRSLSMYLVMKSIGYDVQILNQGYKTFRAYIRNFLENQVNKFCFNVLGGLTGSGKTYFLNLLSKKYNVLNLEKISKHKGSVLGDIPNEKQPTQKKFETNIWFEIQKFDVNAFWHFPIIVDDKDFESFQDEILYTGSGQSQWAPW